MGLLRVSRKDIDAPRDGAAKLLANSSDPGFFNALFGTALAPVTRANVGRVIRLDRALRARFDPLLAKTFDATRQVRDFNRPSTDELATYNYVLNVVPAIAAEIGGVLRTPRPPGVHIDLDQPCGSAKLTAPFGQK